jgi:hypothetical protein
MKAALLVVCGSILAGCCIVPREHPVITEFTFPWSGKAAPYTGFRAFTDQQRLYFEFTVEDHDIVTTPAWAGESTLDDEDRVEIMIARDAALKDYYGIEIDTQGRVHDYAAHYYRQFDSQWNCEGLQTTAQRTAAGYVVKGSLPLSTLSVLTGKPVMRGSTIRIGLFRAEFYGKDRRTHGDANDNWLSWVRPDAKTPDFHVPSAFRDWRVP